MRENSQNQCQEISGQNKGRPENPDGLWRHGERRKLLLEAAAVSCTVMPGAIDRSRAMIEAMVQPHAIKVRQASAVVHAHAVFRTCDGNFAAFQACALASIDAPAADALSDALLLKIAALVSR